jgi:hypothetical protein
MVYMSMTRRSLVVGGATLAAASRVHGFAQAGGALTAGEVVEQINPRRPWSRLSGHKSRNHEKVVAASLSGWAVYVNLNSSLPWRQPNTFEEVPYCAMSSEAA